jgi:hypothetical protein
MTKPKRRVRRPSLFSAKNVFMFCDYDDGACLYAGEQIILGAKEILPFIKSLQKYLAHLERYLEQQEK